MHDVVPLPAGDPPVPVLVVLVEDLFDLQFFVVTHWIARLLKMEHAMASLSAMRKHGEDEPRKSPISRFSKLSLCKSPFKSTVKEYCTELQNFLPRPNNFNSFSTTRNSRKVPAQVNFIATHTKENLKTILKSNFFSVKISEQVEICSVSCGEHRRCSSLMATHVGNKRNVCRVESELNRSA